MKFLKIACWVKGHDLDSDQNLMLRQIQNFRLCQCRRCGAYILRSDAENINIVLKPREADELLALIWFEKKAQSLVEKEK